MRARKGERASYRPIHTPLAATSAPSDVVAGLLGLAPFRTLYVADLDAIAGAGNNAPVIAALRRSYPGLALWVDAGEGDPARITARAAAGLGTSVVGTETLAEATLEAALAAPGAILSLDHDAAGPRGPLRAHEDPTLWPQQVIVMTLAKVGSGEGPDLDALAHTAARAQRAGRDPALYAAGGVRDQRDLDTLARLGLAGALVASALHDGRISSSQARLWA
ncbi:HisA/HisF-related TIM barrel protein [Xanthobacter sp. KR7-65]|uniref:HisA/HisF-related TIM barrel protein n=1 Tax=Xanthobacter sp. KR7-65 TaxID=3156612 RepID=UPI0032B4E10F